VRIKIRHIQMKTILPSIVLWSSAWALGELSLGHALHLFGFPGLAGFVMFPFGLAMMIGVYMETGRRSAVLSIAALTAGLKLLDLLLPLPSPLTVINPSLSIACEGLAAGVFFFPMGLRSSGLRRLTALSLTVFAWKGIYAGGLILLGVFFTIPSWLSLSASRIIGFFVLESLTTAALLFLGIQLFDRYKFPHTARFYPVAPLILLAAAVAQLMF
jgi:hypothetical protein